VLRHLAGGCLLVCVTLSSASTLAVGFGASCSSSAADNNSAACDSGLECRNGCCEMP